MTDQDFKEALSALMDGELDAAEAQRVLHAVSQDPELREAWRRYHLAGASLRGERDRDTDDLADRVQEALRREPVPLALVPRPRREVRLRVWHAVAMAASVAVVAVLVTLGVSRDPATPPTPPVAGSGASPAPRPADTPSVTPGPPVGPTVLAAGDAERVDTPRLTRMTWNDAGPGVEKRLNGYLLSHSGYQSQGVQGFLPYARVVGYDQRD